MNLIVLLLILALIISAVIDLRTQRIPNLIVFPMVVIAMGYQFFLNGAGGLLLSLAGLMLGIGLLIIPYLLGGMGAGDAKLMGAVGATVGPKGVFYAFLLSALAGGIYAVILVILKRDKFRDFFKKTFLKLQIFFVTRKYITEEKNPSEPKLCYGLAIAVGTIAYLAIDLSGYEFPI